MIYPKVAIYEIESFRTDNFSREIDRQVLQHSSMGVVVNRGKQTFDVIRHRFLMKYPVNVPLEFLSKYTDDIFKKIDVILPSEFLEN